MHNGAEPALYFVVVVGVGVAIFLTKDAIEFYRLGDDIDGGGCAALAIFCTGMASRAWRELWSNE